MSLVKFVQEDGTEVGHCSSISIKESEIEKTNFFGDPNTHIRSYGMNDLIVTVTDWQTPIQERNDIALLQVAHTSQVENLTREIVERQKMIWILVNMLGGAVVVTSAELLEVPQRAELETEITVDQSTILRAKGNQ